MSPPAAANHPAGRRVMRDDKLLFWAVRRSSPHLHEGPLAAQSRAN